MHRRRDPTNRRFRLLCWLTGITGCLTWLAWYLPAICVDVSGYDVFLVSVIWVAFTFTLYVITRLARRDPTASLDPANGGLIAALVCLCLGMFAIPQFNFIIDAANRMTSQSCLREAAQALKDYEEKVGHLPPVAISDAQGRPLLSWRVALLPQLGLEELHGQFRLDEPWDSPHNARLLPLIPKVYAPPCKGLCSPAETFVQALVGPGTLFEPGKVTSLAETECADGLDKTILLVEAGDAVPWTKPADVVIELDCPIPPLGVLDRHCRRGLLIRTGPRRFPTANVVFTDLWSRSFPVPHEKDLPERVVQFEKALRAASTWDGKEPPKDIDLEWAWR